jgi:thiol-disulfide isomerase/thioredoxin
VSARRALAGLAAALLLAAGAAAQEPRLAFPLHLVDPVRGTATDVAPGSRVTHLVFFATWCPPCLAEMPRLAELQSTWGRQGYRLVLIAVPTRQTAERIKAFVEREAPPGQVLLDADGAVQRAAGVGDLPAHVLVGPDGTILKRASALADGVVPELERRLGVRRRG